MHGGLEEGAGEEEQALKGGGQPYSLRGCKSWVENARLLQEAHVDQSRSGRENSSFRVGFSGGGRSGFAGSRGDLPTPY